MSEQIQHMQRLQMAGTLAGGIAHDLNNQLTLVLGNIDLALDHLPAGYDAHDLLELAKTAAGRCADMSHRLLHLSRPAGSAMTRVDITAAVVEAQQMLACIKPPKIHMTVEAESGLSIYGNATQIQQTLINLGTNSFHAMPRGGELRIRAYYEHSRVNISVSDTGCGMPASMRQQVFEPFFTTRADVGGSGLGLASVRTIVKAHGGLLGLDSEPGKGTTFLLNFPTFRSRSGEDPTEDTSLPHA